MMIRNSRVQERRGIKEEVRGEEKCSERGGEETNKRGGERRGKRRVVRGVERRVEHYGYAQRENIKC
jgi:hypothetical protein